MSDELLYQVEGATAILTMNRPDRLNALTRTMLTAFTDAVGKAEKDPVVTGIVLTGAGRGFCAGMDMHALKDLGAAGGTASEAGRERTRVEVNPDLPGDAQMGDNFRRTYSYLMSLRKPVIAAINGPCAGMGLSLAAMCDMRFMDETAIISTAFAQRGLVAEHGQSWILPRLIGPSRALDILWTSRKVTAEEAYRMGLADRVSAPGKSLADATDYVENLAANSAPYSLMLMKRQVYRHLNMEIGAALEETDQWIAESTGRGDFKEGVSAYLEKRAPQFSKIKA